MRLLSFYAGIIQFIISIFQLGKAFDWLPDYFISAFISGVSFHVITSQVFHMFGIAKKGFVIVLSRGTRLVICATWKATLSLVSHFETS